MNVIIFTDPFKRYNPKSLVEVLEIHEPVLKLRKNNTIDEISTYNLFKDYGLKKALVQYPDGDIQDNVFFDPYDIIK